MKSPWHRLGLPAASACLAVAAANAFAVASIALSHPQALAFGRFAAGTGGTVTVGPSGVRSRGGGVVLLPSGGGVAAQFGVSGEPNAGYAISLPADGTVFLTSGAHAMAVNGFLSSPGAAGRLSLGGAQTVSVGATLSVAPNQPAGSYAGSFSISIDYN